MCFAYLDDYVSHVCLVLEEFRRVCWISWTWNHRKLWVAMWVLGVEMDPDSAFICWAISSVCFVFKCIFFNVLGKYTMLCEHTYPLTLSYLPFYFYRPPSFQPVSLLWSFFFFCVLWVQVAIATVCSSLQLSYNNKTEDTVLQKLSHSQALQYFLFFSLLSFGSWREWYSCSVYC